MQTQDEILNIDTPENVMFGYEIVGIGSRFMAALVDTIIIVIIQIVAFAGMSMFFGDYFEEASTIFIGIYIFIAFFLLWGYYIFFEFRWNGSSPGKRMVNLRVICQDGTPITLSESIIRNLIRLVDFLPFAYGIGIIAMFIDGKSRRLGDMAASTLVVREQEDVTLASLDKATRFTQSRGSLRAPGELEASVTEWPIERLSQEDLQLIIDFLDRRLTMENSTVIADQILRRMLKRMDLPPGNIRYGEAVYALDKIVKLYYQRSQ